MCGYFPTWRGTRRADRQCLGWQRCRECFKNGEARGGFGGRPKTGRLIKHPATAVLMASLGMEANKEEPETSWFVRDPATNKRAQLDVGQPPPPHTQKQTRGARLFLRVAARHSPQDLLRARRVTSVPFQSKCEAARNPGPRCIWAQGIVQHDMLQAARRVRYDRKVLAAVHEPCEHVAEGAEGVRVQLPSLRHFGDGHDGLFGVVWCLASTEARRARGGRSMLRYLSG